jgi:hypothetical protein
MPELIRITDNINGGDLATGDAKGKHRDRYSGGENQNSFSA